MGVKSQQKVKGDYSQYGISEADARIGGLTFR